MGIWGLMVYFRCRVELKEDGDSGTDMSRTK